MAARIAELDFTDIYLGDDEVWLSKAGVPDSTVGLPDEAKADAQALRLRCQEQEAQVCARDFALAHDGMIYRVSRMTPQCGAVYVLRRMPTEMPHLNSLRLNHAVVERLLRPDMTGLLLIAGRTGNGKTTTASALLVERLSRFGGVAIAAEDPPELPLEGRHRSGVCYQVWASSEQGGYPAVARQIIRWKPNIILFGELRDAETAEESLKAAVNGHLVITTIHADDVGGALQRFHALVQSMTPDSAAKLLSEGLSAVMVQELNYVPGLGLLPQVQFLDFEGGSTGMAARTHVRQMAWQMLEGEVQSQENMRAASLRAMMPRHYRGDPPPPPKKSPVVWQRARSIAMTLANAALLAYMTAVAMVSLESTALRQPIVDAANALSDLVSWLTSG